MTLDPLNDPPPPEVFLAEAPLELVIAQVRFPVILAVEEGSAVAPFQEALRAEYPILRQEVAEDAGPTGVGPMKTVTAWRFSDAEAKWRVSLASQFVALETRQYTCRSELLSRFERVVAALVQHIQPAAIDRLGLRYLNRILGETAEEIGPLIRPEMRGIVGSPLAPQAILAYSEAMFDLDSARLMARWGQLPPGITVEATVDSVDDSSFILDLDMFSIYPAPFGLQEVAVHTKAYAERIYAFFRWMVTDEFLARYGGKR